MVTTVSGKRQLLYLMNISPDPVESLENEYSDAFDGAFPSMFNGYTRGNALRDACLEFYHALDENVVRPCLTIASTALDLPPNDNLETAWLKEGAGAYKIRLARYLPQNIANEDEKNVLYGQHTDYNGFTFLWRNQSNGLQTNINDVWTDVPVLEDDMDALVVNLGDLMQLWTDGAWHSPLHRVLKSKQGSQEPELVSIVFFSGPNPNTKLRPLNSVEKTNICTLLSGVLVSLEFSLFLLVLFLSLGWPYHPYHLI